MTSVGAVTRQIAALEISSKQNTTRPTHQKKPSQNNVSKMLSKFATPNPFPTQSAIPKNVAASSSTTHKQQPPRPLPAQPIINIGHHDGEFEIDKESRSHANGTT